MNGRPHTPGVLVALFLCVLVPAATTQTAKEIITRSNDLMRGTSSYAEVP